jgi:hypothetical protein
MSKTGFTKTTNGDLNLGGTVTVTDLIVEDTLTADNLEITNITVDTIDANNITTVNETVSVENAGIENVSTLNATYETVQTSHIDYLHINGSFFNYESGSWSPILTYICGDQPPGVPNFRDFTTFGSSAQVYSHGYYERVGKQITCYFDVYYTALGQNPVSDGTWFTAIRNLPYEFPASVGGSNGYQSSVELYDCSWPNGFAGPVPAPVVPTYPYPYTGTIYQNTAVHELVQYTWPTSLPGSNHTYDGKTVLISTSIEFYTVVIGVPPYTLSGVTFGPITNFHMTPLITYDCKFRGTITYTTT